MRPARRLPERTCVGCGKIRPKRELVRVVRLDENMVEVDPTGRKAGRGAYLCPEVTCWDLSVRRGALNRALRTTVSPDAQEAIRQVGQNYFASVPIPQDSINSAEVAS